MYLFIVEYFQLQKGKKQNKNINKYWKQYVQLERDIGVIYIKLLKNHLLLV